MQIGADEVAANFSRRWAGSGFRRPADFLVTLPPAEQAAVLRAQVRRAESQRPPDRDALRALLLRLNDAHQPALLAAVPDRRELVAMFRTAAFPIPELPERVTVWRGAAGEDAAEVAAGLSWTLSRVTAIGYALTRHEEGHPGRPMIVGATIAREALVFHDAGCIRLQAEVIFDAPIADLDVRHHAPGVWDEAWQDRARAAFAWLCSQTGPVFDRELDQAERWGRVLPKDVRESGVWRQLMQLRTLANRPVVGAMGIFYGQSVVLGTRHAQAEDADAAEKGRGSIPHPCLGEREPVARSGERGSPPPGGELSHGDQPHPWPQHSSLPGEELRGRPRCQLG